MAPLRNAANRGNLNEVERLLAAGANVNARGNNGYTALMRTVRRANQRPYSREIIKALIIAGANVSGRGPNGRTARNYAINGNRNNNGNRQTVINAALASPFTRLRERGRAAEFYIQRERAGDFHPALRSQIFLSRADYLHPEVLAIGHRHMQSGSNTTPQARFKNRQSANIPVNRPWNNFKNKDPISLNNRSNWKGNRAIEVNTNGRKTYFYPVNFNTYFTKEWKNMSPTSKSSIHPTKRHPLNRSVVRRNQVKLVKFIGNQNKASEP